MKSAKVKILDMPVCFVMLRPSEQLVLAQSARAMGLTVEEYLNKTLGALAGGVLASRSENHPEKEVKREQG